MEIYRLIGLVPLQWTSRGTLFDLYTVIGEVGDISDMILTMQVQQIMMVLLMYPMKMVQYRLILTSMVLH